MSRDFTTSHDPLIAILRQPLLADASFKSCAPAEVSVDMFPKIANLSPHTVFAEGRTLIVNTAGTLTAMHIDVGTTSGFSTLIDGAKLFFVYQANGHNRRVMQRHHLSSLDWSAALKLMKELSEPQFLYLQPDDTMYIRTGQPHFMLSPRSSALYTIECVNPSAEAWDDA